MKRILNKESMKFLNFHYYGEDGQFSLEHVAKFIVECGGLANYENFSYLKLVKKSIFTWYVTISSNSIMS